MLDRILSLLPQGNRKFPLMYLRMVSSISDRMYLARNRYLLAHPILTSGMELLRWMCLNLNVAEMDARKNDIDRYTDIIKYSSLTFRQQIDPVYSNTIAGGRFVKKIGSIAPAEIFLNCEFENPLQELPLEKDWSEWQMIRGVRLLYHDSLELPEDFAKSMFTFKERVPNYLLFAINVPCLLFKYYKYLLDCRKDGSTANVDYFLKEFEYSYFFEDLYDIWTLNVLLRMIENPDDEVERIIRDITMPIRFCTANMLFQGISGIKVFIDLIKQGSIKPQDFLAIHWFRGGRTILDEYNDNCKRFVSLPLTQRYFWLRSFNEFPYFFFVVAITRLFQDGPLKDSLNIRCKELLTTKILPVKMPSGFINPILGNFVREWQEALTKFMNNQPVIFPKPTKQT